jgi:hypothetical protein
VRFLRMWDGFDPEENSLLDLLQFSLKQPLRVQQDRRTPVDIEVSSVYPTRRASYIGAARAVWNRVAQGATDPRAFFLDPPKSENAKVGIWYTQDNIRPPASGWAITRSYDQDGWTPGNFYLPFWQLGTDLFGGAQKGFLGRTISIEELTTPRIGDAGSRPKFCCAFIRNPDPVRMRAIQALKEIGPVDVFGLASSRPVENKFGIASQYRFMLCFENDLYPGYVTEKVFDAWASGVVPLWWGLDREGCLNPDSLINLANFESLEEFTTHIEILNGDSRKLDLMSSLPLIDKGALRPVVAERIRDIILQQTSNG